ncbi:Hypothetical protein A7982_03174 [Minicystis rosea]|nr:Hypothetical protein A7982_03174 [Minicystis rosea]
MSEGMQVRSSDGEKLGKVVACQPTGFVVEKGFLFPKDWTVPYDRISDVRSGEILLSLARSEIGEQGIRSAGAVASAKESLQTAAAEARAALGSEERAVRGTFEQFGKSGEIHVPLVEEEVIASKHVDKIGEVHVRKEIITEEKQITVPVTREVLRVERVAVSQDTRPGDKVFQKETYDIPISEEHITIEKRPIVREELVVGKEIEQAEETASTTVRRERAEIETSGPVRRAVAPGNDTTQLRPTGTGGSRR